jgi:hypothetical protein
VMVSMSGLRVSVFLLLLSIVATRWQPVHATETDDPRVGTVVEGALQHVRRIEHIELYAIRGGASDRRGPDGAWLAKSLSRYYWKADRHGFVLERKDVAVRPEHDPEETHYVNVFDGERFLRYYPQRNLAEVYGPEGLATIGGAYELAEGLNVDTIAPGDPSRWSALARLQAESWGYAGMDTWQGMTCHRLQRVSKDVKYALAGIREPFVGDLRREIWVGADVDFGIVRDVRSVLANGTEIVVSETRWDDWRESNGIDFPRRVVDFSQYQLPDGTPQVHSVSVTQLTEVQINDASAPSPWTVYLPVGTTLWSSDTQDTAKVGGDVTQLLEILRQAESPGDVLDAIRVQHR